MVRSPSPLHPLCSSNRAGLRRAFSLIELMVVIVIIGILAGFLLPGVMGAKQAAQVTAVVTEMKNIEKAIQDFKLKYGIEPPSKIVLFEEGSHWSATPAVPSRHSWTAADATRSRSYLRQIWPQFDFTGTADRDINGDGDSTDILELQGAECLTFFLGGVCSTNVVDNTGTVRTAPVDANHSTPTAGDAVDYWEPRGFSVNPTNPFARGGSRVGPFMEITRLVNLDDDNGTADPDGMPEWLDSIPGQSKPFIYASAYEGKGYRAADLPVGIGSTFISVYTKPSGTPYSENTFQLISAGFDGEYGTGGAYDNTLPVGRETERDNITSFKTGRLE